MTVQTTSSIHSKYLKVDEENSEKHRYILHKTVQLTRDVASFTTSSPTLSGHTRKMVLRVAINFSDGLN